MQNSFCYIREFELPTREEKCPNPAQVECYVLVLPEKVVSRGGENSSPNGRIIIWWFTPEYHKGEHSKMFCLFLSHPMSGAVQNVQENLLFSAGKVLKVEVAILLLLEKLLF